MSYRRGLSTLIGTIVAIIVLVASITVLAGYMYSFQRQASETFKLMEVQNDRLKESLKFDFRNTYVNIISAWNKDSLIRYVLVIDSSGAVIGYREINFLVQAVSKTMLNFTEYGIPVGYKYLFVTALGNTFDPLSSTESLTVYVYRVGTVHPVQNVTVKIEGTPYVTDSEGVVSTLVVCGNRTVEIVSPLTSGGMKYEFVEWWDGSTENPRTFNVVEPTTIACFVRDQYYLTVQASPPSGGTVSPASGWYDGGTQLQISATPLSNYRFGGWIGTGTVSYTGPNQVANIIVDSPIVETAYFVEVASVTFSASGLGSDAPGTILTVDGVAYSYSQLPKSFVWDVGSSHSFSWSSLITVSGSKRYLLTGVSGLSSSQSGTVIVPSGGGNIIASYTTQYTVTLQTTGLGGDFSGNSVLFDGNGYRVYDGNLATVWVASGRTVSYTWTSPINSNTAGKRYVITSAQSGQVLVDSPKTVQASYKTQYYLTVNSQYDSPTPSSGWFDSGTQITASVTSPVSGGSGIQYVCIGWTGSGSVPSSGSSTSVQFTITAPSSITWNWKTQYYLTMQSNPSNGGSVSPGSGWYDVGVQVQISATPSSNYRFSSWSGSGTGSYSGVSNPATVTMNGPITEVANFIEIATVTFAVNGMSSDASGTVLTVDGVSYSYSQLPKSFTWDVGTSHSFSWTSPVSVSSSKRYVWTSTSGLSTLQSGTINVPSGGGSVTATYKTQYTVTLQTSGLGGDFSGNSVTFDGTMYRVYDGNSATVWVDSGRTVTYSWASPIDSNTAGKRYVITSTQSGNVLVDSQKTVSASYKIQYYLTVNSQYGSPTPSSDWFDSGTQITASVSSPVSGGAGTRYVCIGWTGTGSVPSSGSGTSVQFTINAPSSITWNWKTQYYLTMQASPSVGGTVSPSSGWYDAGTQVQISATPSANYRFGSWSGSGTGSYTGTNNPATITVNSPITETANFVEIATVTFSVQGIGSDSSGTVLTVDGASYTYSQLPKSFTWDVGSSHSFSWSSSVSAGSGKQYAWVSTSGLSTAQSGSVNVPSGGGSVVATYKTQYYLTVNSQYGSPTPSSGWFDAGSSITASMSSPVSGGTGIQYVCTGWSGTGSVPSSGSSTSVQFTINAPSSITWNWKTQYYLTMQVSPSGGGTASPSSGWRDAGTQVQISASPAANYRFGGWSGSGSGSYSGSSNPATITMNGPITETANFVKLGTVTFSANGLSSDASETVLTVDGVSYSYSQLPKSFTWDVGSSHSFSWSDSVSAGSGKRYVWVSTSGLSTSRSGSITVPDGTGSVTATYNTQYYLTVSSTYGNPTPTSTWFDAGTTVTASITSPVYGGSGTRYVCTGWTGTGSVPSSGSSTSVQFTINAPSSITWNWKTQYYLTMQANPSGGGSVNPGSGWYDSGTQVQISASANSGYQFASWSGSGSGSYTGSANPATITVNGPITETANFNVGITFKAYFMYYGSYVYALGGGNVLTVDGVNYYTGDLPRTFYWSPGSSHYISWNDVYYDKSSYVSGNDERYLWTSSAGPFTSKSGTFTVPSSPGEITAYYGRSVYVLVYSPNPSGGGSVSPSTSDWYPEGSTFTASANSGYLFSYWSMDSGSATSSNNPLTLYTPRTLQAVFYVRLWVWTRDSEGYSINGVTVSASWSGGSTSATSSGDGDAFLYIPPNTQVTVTVPSSVSAFGYTVGYYKWEDGMTGTSKTFNIASPQLVSAIYKTKLVFENLQTGHTSFIYYWGSGYVKSVHGNYISGVTVNIRFTDNGGYQFASTTATSESSGYFYGSVYTYYVTPNLITFFSMTSVPAGYEPTT